MGRGYRREGRVERIKEEDEGEMRQDEGDEGERSENKREMDL